MMRNMVTSLLEHERIVTTRAKGKVLRSYGEKVITRAKKNLKEGVTPEEILHNKREVMRDIKDRDVVAKLFDELAPRYKARQGGYIRIIHMPDRLSDSAQMSIVELVDRKEKVRTQRRVKVAAESHGTEGGTVSEGGVSRQKDDKKDKWYNKFLKK